MSTDERYNGWANRETWAVSLYLGNDQTWQEDCLDLVRRLEPRGAGGPTDPAEIERDWQYLAGEVIREYVDELAYSVSEGDASRDTRMAILDMGSLWRVDWREIGASFLEDVS